MKSVFNEKFLKKLLGKIVEEFELDLYGRHGIYHWARVLENALYVSKELDVDKEILILFSILHDSKRVNDSYDKKHGVRAAEFVRLINNDFLNLSEHKLKLLVFACEGHNSIRFNDNLTIQACWDADRLDLLRANIKPSSEYMNLAISKEKSTMDWANKRSKSNSISEIAKYWIKMLE
jgi:uncharacterized protein